MATAADPADDPNDDEAEDTLTEAANVLSLDRQVLGHALATNDSDLAKRFIAARRAGLAFGGERDYYDVLGYDRHPLPEDYIAKFQRNDIARTIVTAPATTAWRTRPTVVDDEDDGPEDEPGTDFERAVEFLFDEFRALHYLERWDIGVGLGEYGVLFLGVREPEGENRTLADPLEPDTFEPLDPEDDGQGLSYLSVFTQAAVVDLDLVNDPMAPRFGLPEFYELEFSTGDGTRQERVHHSRVLHAAEDLLENEVRGTPRLLPVYNRIDDLEKVVGGSAEMFWRGARREMILNYQGEGNPQDADEVRDDIEDIIHGLETVGTLQNTDVETLGGDYPDPSGNVDNLLKLISGETGIPKRILTGSERGELASTQDRATWLGRVAERQEQFCEPMLLRPFIDRLLELGLLPEPQGGTYTVKWPNLFELNELEQAELRAKNAEALAESAPGGDPGALADAPEIREKIMGWDPERGSETSLDPEENPEQVERDVPEDEAEDVEDLDRLDEFDEVIEGVNTEPARRRAAPDGGEPE